MVVAVVTPLGSLLVLLWGRFSVTFWLLFGHFLVTFWSILVFRRGSEVLCCPWGSLWASRGVLGFPGGPSGLLGGLFEDTFWSHISCVFLNDLRCSFLVCVFCAVFGSLFDPFEGHAETYFRQRAFAKRKGRYAGYTVKIHDISRIL